MKSQAEVIDRLLASDEPSVRWKVRARVLGEAPAKLRSLQNEIRDSPRVRQLLSEQEGTDGPIAPHRDVYSKWRGAHWILASLADLGYPPGDRALLRARDQVMDRWLAASFLDAGEFEAQTRGAAYKRAGVPLMQGRYRRCASQQGNALYSVLTLGLEDERAEQLVQRLLHWQWPDGGWNCDRNPDASHSSFMESILPLRALSLFGRAHGAQDAGAGARRAAEIFLERRLYRRRSNGRVIRREFAQLHYPLYWHYDLLGGLKVMAEAGLIDDPRCADALDQLEGMRLPDGGWPATGRYYTLAAKAKGNVERVDWGGVARRRSSEWITADALFVLRAAGRI